MRMLHCWRVLFWDSPRLLNHDVLTALIGCFESSGPWSCRWGVGWVRCPKVQLGLILFHDVPGYLGTWHQSIFSWNIGTTFSTTWALKWLYYHRKESSNLQSILKWPMSDVKALAGQLQLGFEVLLSGQFGDVRGPCWGDLVIVCNFWMYIPLGGQYL